MGERYTLAFVIYVRVTTFLTIAFEQSQNDRMRFDINVMYIGNFNNVCVHELALLETCRISSV